MGLSTIVGRTYKKKGERTVAELRRIERLRKLQRGMLYYKSRQRSFGKAMRLLSKLTDKMNLPKSVSEEASYIYRKALESKLIKGRTIPAMVCASIYGACRNLQVPKTLEDVSNACGIGKERIARNYRVLVEQLGLEAEPIDPAKALSGIVAKLFVSEKASRKALEMIRKAQEVSIAVGKHPASLAAAAIYVACIATGERRTQKEVARAADVSEVTLRKRSKELGKLINRT
jgi:transcription initiation factor TFIIB